MAAPAWVGAAVSGGTGIAGGLISNAGAAKRDHDARNFALMQGDIEWNRQQTAWGLQNNREDEVWNRQNAYNMMLWDKQNAYNSPLEQMKRYKEAGLNPNLIYGQSNTGGSIATSNLESGKIQGGGRPGNWAPEKRDYSFIGSAMMDALAFREKSVQIDNLAEQNKVLQEEQALKAATTAGVLLNNAQTGDMYDTKKKGAELGNAKAQFELDLQGDLRQSQIDAAREAVRRTRTESDLALHRDQREAVNSNMSVKEALQRITNMQKEGHGKDIDNQLKQLDLMIKQMGPQGGDVWQRILGRILQQLDQTGNKYVRPPENNNPNSDGMRFQWKWRN